jgi:DNA ligase-1
VETIRSFLHVSKIFAADDKPLNRKELSIKEVFMRVLDKNLKAGIAHKTLEAVQWNWSSGQVGEGKETGQTFPKERSGLSHAKPSVKDDLPSLATETKKSSDGAEDGLPVLQAPTRLGGFSCALGKTVLRKGLEKALQVPQATSPARSVVSSTPRWLASRKLDGVRLLVVMDVFTPTEGQPAKVLDTWTLSRNGKEYHTLDILKGELAQALSGSNYVKTLLAHEPRYTPPPNLGQGYTQRLVLDGELCHLIYDSDVPANQDDAVKEDFAEVVSRVRRKDYTIQRPAMFLLDVLPWSVFLAGMNKDTRGAATTYKVFAERVKDCQALVEQVAIAVREIGTQPVLRHLQQTEVTSIEQVEKMIEEAAEKGWEGLILRRGDQPYEGRRR